jgi:ATP-binding cassette subfamily B protein
MNLITRLYDPPPGTIYWRGQDILNARPGDLRKEIGYALQTVHLFSASIRENLAFGLDHEPSIAELEEAAERAQILGEIRHLPRQWDTEIGEKGVRLSGGQKQRLALARLLLRHTPVLLLDDVLSAVDQVTERQLIASLSQLGVATLIASHRGTALKQCDEVLILSEGRIESRGTFAELSLRYPELTRDVQ